MHNRPKQVLYWSWGLALLQADRFEEDFLMVTALADALAVGERERLLQFTHYLRRQWVPLAPIVSVYGPPIRTNNVAESFNRHIEAKLGGAHPRFWVFLAKLKDVIAEEFNKLMRWRETGCTGRRPRSKVWMWADEKIIKNQRLLETGRFSVADFLNASTTPHQRLDLYDATRRFRADSDLDHELPAPADMLNPRDVFTDDSAVTPIARARARPRRRRAIISSENSNQSSIEDLRSPPRGPRMRGTIESSRNSGESSSDHIAMTSEGDDQPSSLGSGRRGQRLSSSSDSDSESFF